MTGVLAAQPVVVVGDANVDMLLHLPDRGVPLAERQVTEPELHGGGTGANTAVALARLAVPVRFVGAIGDDGYGRFIQRDFAAEGVGTGGLVIKPDAYTPMVMAIIEPDGERMLVIWPPVGGAHTHLHPDDIDPRWLAGAAWLHTTGMCLRAAPVRDAVLHSMTLARAAGLTVSLDLNLRLELWGADRVFRRMVAQAMELADVVFGSATDELLPFTGAPTPLDAARTLAAGARTVVARLGPDGALAVDPAGAAVTVPAQPVTVVDTLGAGDAFNGGFIAARAGGASLWAALSWGNAVAGLKITRTGARAVPHLDEVRAAL